MPNVKIHPGLAGHDIATNTVLSMVATAALREKNTTIDTDEFTDLGIDTGTIIDALRDNSDVINLIRQDELPSRFSSDDIQGIVIAGVRFDVQLLVKAQKELPLSDVEEQDGPDFEFVRGLAHYRGRHSVGEDGKPRMSVTRFTRSADTSKHEPFFTRIREIWVDVLVEDPKKAWEDLIATCFKGVFTEPIEGLSHDSEDEIYEYLPHSEVTKYVIFGYEGTEDFGIAEKVQGKWLIREVLEEVTDPSEQWERFLDDVWPVTNFARDLAVGESVTSTENVVLGATEGWKTTEGDEPTPLENWPDAELFVEDHSQWPDNDVRFEIVVGVTNVSVEACRGVEYDELKASYFKGEKGIERIARFRSIRAKDAEELEKIAAEWLEKELGA